MSAVLVAKDDKGKSKLLTLMAKFNIFLMALTRGSAIATHIKALGTGNFADKVIEASLDVDYISRNLAIENFTKAGEAAREAEENCIWTELRYSD